eukprot:6791694-Prymnesium_polylepis.1
MFVTGPRHVWGACRYGEGFCDLPKGSALEVRAEPARVRSWDAALDALPGGRAPTLLVLKGMYADHGALDALLAAF